MEWTYHDYPVMENGIPVLTSGTVEVKATATPRMERISFRDIPSLTLARPTALPCVKWKIASEVTDDLKRFITGKYWHKIDIALYAEHLSNIGLTEAAQVYAEMARA